MKGMDIFCASQAATAIRLSDMDNENDLHVSSSFSSSSSSTIHHLAGGGRAIDRYNPIIRDPRRLGRSIPSCSSQSQTEFISPVPLLHSHQTCQQNIKKGSILKHSSSDPTPRKEKSDSDNRSPTTPYGKKKKKIVGRRSLEMTEPPTQSHEEKRKSSEAKAVDNDCTNRNYSTTSFAAPPRRSWSFTSAATPAGSSRYLLSSDQNQTAFLNLISDFDPVLKLEAEEPPKSHPPAALTRPKHELSARDRDVKPSSSSRSSSDQVVVLRVSLHCKGCERKMRKHISRMEGVSSFNIDFAAKKVTVVGNVTPLGVLASISKVKNAQLWTPAAAGFPQPNCSEMSKNNLNQPPTTTAIVSL